MAALLPREPTGNSAGLPVSRRAVRRQRMAGAILVLAAALLYVATLDTGLQPYELHGGDLITHQYAQVQARPSNAPGYPLYTMGGWLWFHGIRAVADYLNGQSGQSNPDPEQLQHALGVALDLAALRHRLPADTRHQISRQATGRWPGCWPPSMPSPTSSGTTPPPPNSTAAPSHRHWPSFMSTCSGVTQHL